MNGNTTPKRNRERGAFKVRVERYQRTALLKQRGVASNATIQSYRPLAVPTKILKQLPEQDGELQYRTKSSVEEHERIALESELGAF
jgi:hypothetical protein